MNKKGDILITGSETGECVIWRPLHTIHHPYIHQNDDDDDEEEEEDEEEEQDLENMKENEIKNDNDNDNDNNNDNDNENNDKNSEIDLLPRSSVLRTHFVAPEIIEESKPPGKWVPIAMTFGTNTSGINCIMANFQYKEQAAFIAVHKDGEIVLYSIYGAGALKIGRYDRPIVSFKVNHLFGFAKANECFQYALCTGINIILKT